MRSTQEKEAENKYKVSTTPARKKPTSATSTRSVHRANNHDAKPKKVVRQPDAPGLLWRTRRGDGVSSTRPYFLEEYASSVTAGKEFHFQGDFLSLGPATALNLNTAADLKFKLDGGDVEDSYILGDDVEVIPNSSGFAGCEEIIR